VTKFYKLSGTKENNQNNPDPNFGCGHFCVHKTNQKNYLWLGLLLLLRLLLLRLLLLRLLLLRLRLGKVSKVENYFSNM
jgi:hypothetical protein